MNRDSKIILGAGIIVITFWSLSWLLLGDRSFEERGTFGDMFGAVNALFSGFAFLGVIYAILLQRTELSLQRTELSLTRQELQKSANAQERSEKALAKQADAMVKTARINSLTASLESLEKRRKSISPINDERQRKVFVELSRKISAITNKLDSLMDESLIDEALEN